MYWKSVFSLWLDKFGCVWRVIQFSVIAAVFAKKKNVINLGQF